MKPRSLRCRTRHAALAALVAVAVVGCGDPDASEDEPPIGPAVIQRYTGVEYRQECADDVIEIDEVVYYPLPKDSEQIDRDWYHASAEPAGTSMRAPDGTGNGGESGTMIVFADGVAEFIADSGEVSWLSLVEPEIDLEAAFGC